MIARLQKFQKSYVSEHRRYAYSIRSITRTVKCYGKHALRCAKLYSLAAAFEKFPDALHRPSSRIAKSRKKFIVMADTLARTIWPVTPPTKTRDPKKPMRIICLGLPRTGTDSLRTALSMLGYGPIWHGFEMPMTRSNEPIYWTPLLQAKKDGNHQPGREFDWDVMLGDLEVLMDMPPMFFAEELLDYYPDAKVILNRRKDMDAWHRSLHAAMRVIDGWSLWTIRLFDAEMCWWYRTMFLSVSLLSAPGKSFEEDGKRWAEEHYARMEAKLKREARSYLDWEVGQGWSSLCQYLEKDQPDVEFPFGNRGGEQFEKNAEKAMEKMAKRAMLKAAVFVGVIAIGVGYALWLWR